MATNTNNTQVNSFTKGMNTDISLDRVSNELYIFGKNIRITTSTLPGLLITSNNAESIVTPVIKELELECSTIPKYDYILASKTIDDVGAFIIAHDKNEDGYLWSVYRVNRTNDDIVFTKQFTSSTRTTKSKFSVVIEKEINNIVKIYIADGEHPIMQLNINETAYNNNLNGNIDNITSNRLYAPVPLGINGLVSGRLKTSQVQYVYRLYKRYGVSSKLFPITHKIQIIDNNKNKETGCAEDTNTSIGVSLSFRVTEVKKYIPNVENIFDSIQVIRLLYIKPGEDAVIDIIHDDKFVSGLPSILIIDNGNTSLKTITIQELSQLDGILIVPQIIESNQGYLFAANLKDISKLKFENKNIDSRAFQCDIRRNYKVYDPTYSYSKTVLSINDIQRGCDTNAYSNINLYTKDGYDLENACRYGNIKGSLEKDAGNGKNVTWELKRLRIPVDRKPDWYLYSHNNPDEGVTVGNVYSVVPPPKAENEPVSDEIVDYLGLFGIKTTGMCSYDDLIISSMCRSLRRSEVYRYGIIYYDKYGTRSDVLWIADIRTPDLSENKNVDHPISYYFHDSNLDSIPLGIKFTVTVPKDLNIVSYLIVRCAKLPEYSRVLMLVATSRPTRQYYGNNILSPFYPIPFLTSQFIYTSTYRGFGTYAYGSGSMEDRAILMALSPEINIGNDNCINTIKNSQTQLNAVTFRYQTILNRDLLQLMYPGKSLDRYWNDINRTIKPIEGGITSAYTPGGLRLTPFFKADEYGSIYFEKDFVLGSGISTEKTHYMYKHYIKAMMHYLTGDLMEKTKDDVWGNDYAYKFVEDYYSYDYTNVGTLFAVDGIVRFDIDNSEKPGMGLNDTVRRNKFAALASLNIHRGYWDAVLGKHAGVSDPDDFSTQSFKSEVSLNAFYYREDPLIKNTSNRDNEKYVNVLDISDVSDTNWEDGFSSIQHSGTAISSGVLSYKSHGSIVGNKQYINWVCNGMYDLRLSNLLSLDYTGVTVTGDNEALFRNRIKAFTYNDGDREDSKSRLYSAAGWTGPGPKCLIINYERAYWDADKTQEKNLAWTNPIFVGEKDSTYTKYNPIGTIITNIVHTAQLFAGTTEEQKRLDIYYGFGNYGTLKEDKYDKDVLTGSITVFDGDVYNIPAELISMYKTYNFNSLYDTIPSAQIVNYVPLESSINTCFDYGMNYRNTNSPNILKEPGDITGISTTDRPAYLYNMIYSDNNTSADIYNAESNVEEETVFTSRIMYSQKKILGEFLDNWSVFKANDYIDGNNGFGEITNMSSLKNELYFWQTNAFGKLSVNERSLITDENNNKILLGQGDILLRVDYIDSQHGMRKNDFSNVSVENNIYWIDANNRSLLTYSGNKVYDYGKSLNVLSIINEQFDETSTLNIDYDIQHNELLCKMFKDSNLLIFNTEHNVATSIYTRLYDDVIQFNNVLYGLSEKYTTRLAKINNITVEQYDSMEGSKYLTPFELQFVVNYSPSVTKTFDNLQIVMMKKEQESNFAKKYMIDKTFNFITNIDRSEYNDSNTTVVTYREGNLLYSIPRSSNSSYGNRLKGKWMKVDIVDNKPKEDHTISHIITKFRQSFI